MLVQISLLFIIFLVLLSTVVLSILKKQKIENFTTPTAVNVPAANHTEGKPFFVGNRLPENPFPSLAPNGGKYTFRKAELLYDGVWGEKCQNRVGFETCDWKPTDANFPLDKKGYNYGANHFFNTPEIQLKPNEEVAAPPECPANSNMYDNGPTYEENNKINPPVYLQTPDLEDVLGFTPQNNNNFLKLPLPQIANF